MLTGQLGDVMKESGQIALSYVRSHAAELGIDAGKLGGRFHVHVPAGAVPKDGPSAGVTMVTALASLLAGTPVKSTIGMTGEVTLQGRVLPIGGVKQKVARGAPGRTEGGHPPQAQRGRPRGRARAGARGDRVPPRRDDRRGARDRARPLEALDRSAGDRLLGDRVRRGVADDEHGEQRLSDANRDGLLTGDERLVPEAFERPAL